MRKKEYGKKIIAIMLAAAMMTGLAACGSSPQETPPVETQVQTQAPVEEEPASEPAEEQTEEPTESTYTVTEENNNEKLPIGFRRSSESGMRIRMKI